MKPWQRKLLFFICFVLFLVFAPLIIFYSFGYRFDFEKKKFTKTGAIFIKAFPKEVEVVIDEKIKRKTDSLFGSVLLENILPKKYRVKVEKEGYFPWEKELEVMEEKVTEVKNLILFPKNLRLYQILENVEQFWVLPSRKEIIFKTTDDKNWSLKVYSLEKKIKSFLLSQRIYHQIPILD